MFGIREPRGTKGFLYVCPLALANLSSSLTLPLLLNGADNEIVFKEISRGFVVSENLGINTVGLGKYSLEKITT